MKSGEHNPRVFISYCQQTREFSDAVLELSNKLVGDGIDVILDQYVQSPPEGWPRWMETAIDESEFVLMVCTAEYQSRVLGRVPAGVGRGVRWEGNLIYQHIYNAATLNTKFIPIVLRDEDIEFIPMPVQGATYYNVLRGDQYDALYWRLRGINPVKRPALGKLKPLPTRERKSLFVSRVIDVDLWDKAVWRGAGYLITQDHSAPPCFCLPFIHEEYARKIFQGWMETLGDSDRFENLRVAIIEGDVPGEKKGYAIQIGSNWDRLQEQVRKRAGGDVPHCILSFSRWHRAHPKDDFRMLNMFKAEYRRQGVYLLAPAIVDDAKPTEIRPLWDCAILKRQLIFRNVSDIRSSDDPDYLAIVPGKPTRAYVPRSS